MTEEIALRLLLVRHGETDLNREHRMQSFADHPLNDQGKAQAGRLAVRLETERIDAAYSSDLRRARETAELLALPHGLAVRSDARLREQNFGEWEENVWPDLARLASPEEVARFLGDPEFAPPGGESKRQVLARLTGFFGDRLRESPGRTLLVVTHGGPIVVFLHHVLDVPFGTRMRFYPRNGGLSEFHRIGGFWRLVTFDAPS